MSASVDGSLPRGSPDGSRCPGLGCRPAREAAAHIRCGHQGSSVRTPAAPTRGRCRDLGIDLAGDLVVAVVDFLVRVAGANGSRRNCSPDSGFTFINYRNYFSIVAHRISSLWPPGWGQPSTQRKAPTKHLITYAARERRGQGQGNTAKLNGNEDVNTRGRANPTDASAGTTATTLPTPRKASSITDLPSRPVPGMRTATPAPGGLLAYAPVRRTNPETRRTLEQLHSSVTSRSNRYTRVRHI